MNIYQFALVSMVIVSHMSLSACKKAESQGVEQTIPFVMVTQPARGADELKSYAGHVQARQQTALAFRVPGQIIERYVDVGDRVKVGQVLARLDVKDAQLQLSAAQAQLDSAYAHAKITEEELKRFKQLLPENAVSRSQYDAMLNQHQNAQAALKQAQANYNTAQNQTQYNALIAHKNGVITERHIETGQVIAAGQAAFTLAIDGEREVVIGVSEQAIAAIQVGQVATVKLWSNHEQQLAAKVREISPAADQSRTFSVKVSLAPTTPAVAIGQSARVFFQYATDSKLSVPLSSVSANEQQAYVWVVQDDHSLRKVPVTLGAYGRHSVPVLSGLNAQDYVVVGGVHLLREKQKINPIDQDNRAVRVSTGAAL
jgi:membrane fusion protein, multidrug efflux system